jgi:hypothetical protein
MKNSRKFLLGGAALLAAGSGCDRNPEAVGATVNEVTRVASDTILRTKELFSIENIDVIAEENRLRAVLIESVGDRKNWGNYRNNLEYREYLMSTDSPELREYLRYILNNSELGIETLFENNFLSREHFEDYMDQKSQIIEIANQIQGEEMRQEVGLIAHSFMNNASPSKESYLLNVLRNIDNVEALGTRETTLMPHIAHDRNLNLAIMLTETFPGPPNEMFSDSTRQIIARLMIREGYNPAYKIRHYQDSDGNDHIFGANFHLNRESAYGVIRDGQNGIMGDVAGYIRGEMIDVENPFYSLIVDQELAAFVQIALNKDNLNRFENFTLYADNYDDEIKLRFRELFESKANRELFVALAAYFQINGFESNNARTLGEIFVNSDFSVQDIIESLILVSPYVEKIIKLYNSISKDPIFFLD